MGQDADTAQATAYQATVNKTLTHNAIKALCVNYNNSTKACKMKRNNVTIIFILTLYFIILHISCIKKTSGESTHFPNVVEKTIAPNPQVLGKSEGENNKIIITKIDSVIRFSKVFKSLKFIKLDNKPEATIGVVDKIVVNNKFIYILDKYKTKSLKRFDIDGKYVTSYGTIGPGPNEQNELTDFIVSNNNIIIYDQFKCKLYFYEIDGKFIRTKPTSYIFSSFFRTKNNDYLIHTLDADNTHIHRILNYSIIKADTNFVVKSINAYRAYNKYTSVTSKNNLNRFNNNFYYHEPLNDTIFSIRDDGKLLIDYIFDFTKFKLDNKYKLKENKDKFLKIWKSEDKALFFGDYVATTNFLFYTFTMKGLGYRGIYSKLSKKNIVSSTVFDDINYSVPLNNISTCLGDTLIGSVSSDYLLHNYSYYSKDEWMKHVDASYVDLMSNLNKGDNYVIFLYVLKDF